MVESIQTLQSLAQSGQAYTKDPYDRQRFDSIKQICARLLQEVAGLSQAQAESLIFDEEGYRTPKVDVRGTVFQDQRILLVQEEADGLWCLPGGWADLHETRADRLVMFLNSDRHGPKQFYQAYKLFFLCELIQGECRPTTDTSAVAFFAADVLPALSTGERPGNRFFASSNTMRTAACLLTSIKGGSVLSISYADQKASITLRVEFHFEKGTLRIWKLSH